MIANDRELQSKLERIDWFQQQIAYLRRIETNPVNYFAAASGFLAEVDRMQLEVREYFSFPPNEQNERAGCSGKCAACGNEATLASFELA